MRQLKVDDIKIFKTLKGLRIRINQNLRKIRPETMKAIWKEAIEY